MNLDESLTNEKKTVKKKTTSKISKSKQNISDLKNKLKISEDKHVRLLAEFDNYKKRKNNEIEKFIKYEGFDFFKSVLPILDDIDRTLNLKDVKNNKSIFDGFSMIKSKIANLLELKEIATYNSIDESFNPEFHEAIMMKKSKIIIVENLGTKSAFILMEPSHLAVIP